MSRPVIILGGNAYMLDDSILLACPVHADLGEPTLTIADPDSSDDDAAAEWYEVMPADDEQTALTQRCARAALEAAAAWRTL